MGADKELPGWAIWLQAIGPTMAGIIVALVAAAIGVVLIVNGKPRSTTV